MGRPIRHRKPVRRTPAPRPQQALEKEADTFLAKRKDDPHDEAERSYYRSVGAVLQRDGKWFAIDAGGNIMGEFAERWLAWQLADKLGMQRMEA